MLSLLDNLLRQILMDGFKSLGSSLQKDQVTFEPPDDTWRAALTEDTLNVYLVDIRENRKLRSNERSRDNQNGVVIEEPAPARMDCHYLISTFGSARPPLDPTPDEHRLLYVVAAILLQQGSLNPARIYPQNSRDLADWAPFQDVELPIVVAPVEGFPKLAEFWGTMGTKQPWRPVLYLIVTIPVALIKEQAGYMVTTRITEYRISGSPEPAETLIEIGSRVVLPPRPLAVGKGTVNGIVGGTAVTVIDAAPFRVGDVVTNNTARATIAQIAGNDLTLSNSLAGLAAGNTLRIANITPSQNTFRVNDLTGLTPGGPVLIGGEDAANSGTAVTERAVIQSIAGDGFVTLSPIPPRAITYNMNVLPASAPTLRGFAAETWVQLADMTGTELGTTTTDIEGRFKFAGLNAGNYTLWVRALGFGETTLDITVPSMTGNYDVQL